MLQLVERADTYRARLGKEVEQGELLEEGIAQLEEACERVRLFVEGPQPLILEALQRAHNASLPRHCLARRLKDCSGAELGEDSEAVMMEDHPIGLGCDSFGRC